jgi:predicted HTH transcriptional regulator
LAAFANADGGCIIFGVRDRPREIVGVKEVTDGATERWPATIMVHGRRGRPVGNEIAFLKTEIYLSEVEPRLQTLTALSRFSVRA